MRNYVVYCFLFLLPAWLHAQTAQDLFAQGNAAYNGGNYDLAIEKYTLILDQELESSALYYNLGNAHYRLGKVAESIFYFEKAHQFSPGDESIRNNRAQATPMPPKPRISALPPASDWVGTNWLNSPWQRLRCSMRRRFAAASSMARQCSAMGSA